jgi:hypothetical protein
MNDVPTSVFPIEDLTEEEAAAVRAASQRALEELREDKRRQTKIRAAWAPALVHLEENDAISNLAGAFIAATKLCGWDEATDDKLARLVVGLIEELELKVAVTRHRNRPDTVHIGGYLIRTVEGRW